MSLSQGTQLGSYEVTGQLGAGGMGEVYRATDTKLGRDVAIKTLPASLAGDVDRLARFEREAKLLATLHHPHIASVFGLDEHDGTLYLAMELIEGETLEEKLKHGALEVEDALRLALQIAEALEAAHEKGVVHRDLKPANIMIGPNAQVKVLDFGLAKAFSTEPEEASPGRSPALSLAMTQQGIILGTAGYMSPEQASGQGTDQRADIWAFGVVLYEMLTGLPLFSGETVPHILAAVLQNEPDWKRLPKNLHPRLKTLLERCLRKKPRVRYQSIGDVRVDIEEILSDPAGITVEGSAVAAAPAASGFSRFGRPAGIAAVAAAAAAALVWWLTLPGPPEPRPVNRFDYDVPQELTLRRTGRRVLALSRDGRHFALNTNSGIYLRRMGELDARLIAGTEEDLMTPFFSPDGQTIAYRVAGDDEIKRISINGGAPVIVAGNISGTYGADWASDGTMLIGQLDGIYRVAGSGGTAELVIDAGSGRVNSPQLLPDGDSVLYTADRANNWDTAEIVVESLSTEERTVVQTGGSDARYLPTGHIVYAYEDDLFGIAFDLETLSVSGGPVSLVQGLARGNNTGAANYAIADDGTLVYLTGASFGEGGNRTIVWVDRNGDETGIGMSPCACPDFQTALSPDETRAAVSIFDIGRAETDIWIWNFAAETQTRLTFEAGSQQYPVWTADSQRIVYHDPNTGIVARNADGTGTIETLFEEESTDIGTTSLDPDGNVLFNMSDDIYLLNVADGTAAPLIAGELEEFHGMVSPDGRFVAYVSDETGDNEVYVRPYPDVDSGKWQVSSNSGIRPKWSDDGSRLYFMEIPTLRMMEAQISTEPSFSRTTPTPVFSIREYWGYSVTDDDERMLVIKQGLASEPGQSQQAQVIVVQNWIEELKRQVPVD